MKATANTTSAGTLSHVKVDAKTSQEAGATFDVRLVRIFEALLTAILKTCKARTFENGERIENAKYSILFGVLNSLNYSLENFGAKSNLSLPYAPKGSIRLTSNEADKLYSRLIGNQRRFDVSEKTYVAYRDNFLTFFVRPEATVTSYVSAEAETETIKKREAQATKREEEEAKNKK